MKPSNTKPKFQFSMKTLMLGMTVAALFSAVLGWIGNEKTKPAFACLAYGVIAFPLMFFHSVRMLRKLHFGQTNIFISCMTIACTCSFVAVLCIQIHLFFSGTTIPSKGVGVAFYFLRWLLLTYPLAVLLAAWSLIFSGLISTIVSYLISKITSNNTQEPFIASYASLLFGLINFPGFYSEYEKVFRDKNIAIAATAVYFSIWIFMPIVLLWWADRAGRGLNKPPSHFKILHTSKNKMQVEELPPGETLPNETAFNATELGITSNPKSTPED